MANSTHTHWRMTINNYDEVDLALVQQGYPDHIRQMVYTLEEGTDGTPHIQAYIKMKRDCRLTHMKKLFPRGNFGYLDSAEYKLNSQRYAQKLDATARSPAVIMNGDPLHTVEGTIRLVIERIIRQYEEEEDLATARRWVEREMVLEDYTMAKVFVSSTYKTMWREFGHDMYQSIHTHTHTHTHIDELISHEEGITNADGTEEREGSSTSGSATEESEDYEDGCGEADEGYTESTDSGSC